MDNFHNLDETRVGTIGERYFHFLAHYLFDMDFSHMDRSTEGVHREGDDLFALRIMQVPDTEFRLPYAGHFEIKVSTNGNLLRYFRKHDGFNYPTYGFELFSKDHTPGWLPILCRPDHYQALYENGERTTGAVMPSSFVILASNRTDKQILEDGNCDPFAAILFDDAPAMIERLKEFAQEDLGIDLMTDLPDYNDRFWDAAKREPKKIKSHLWNVPLDVIVDLARVVVLKENIWDPLIAESFPYLPQAKARINWLLKGAVRKDPGREIARLTELFPAMHRKVVEIKRLLESFDELLPEEQFNIIDKAVKLYNNREFPMSAYIALRYEWRESGRPFPE